MNHFEPKLKPWMFISITCRVEHNGDISKWMSIGGGDKIAKYFLVHRFQILELTFLLAMSCKRYTAQKKIYPILTSCAIQKIDTLQLTKQ